MTCGYRDVRLVTVDVGGTLAAANGNSLTAMLCALSPLPPAETRRWLRQTLHVAAALTPDVVRRVCAAISIPVTAFPVDYRSPVMTAVDGARDALARIARYAPVVTLANVVSLDFEEAWLQSHFGDTVTANYPSCRIGFAKPDPETFRFVARQHDIPMDALLHIGDDWACDVEGALAVGARAIWISNGRSQPSTAIVDHERLEISNNIVEAASIFVDSASRPPSVPVLECAYE